MNSQPLTLDGKRIPAIDRLRGLLIFLMILFQALERFDSLGVLCYLGRHFPNEDALYVLPTLTLSDLGAPVFFLLISLNFMPSFRRRLERDGRGKTYLHFAIRFLAILGFGTAKKAIERVFDLLGGGNLGYPAFITWSLFAVTVVAFLSLLATFVTGFIKKAARVSKISARTLTLALAALGVMNLAIAGYNAYSIFVLGDDLFHFWDVLQAIGAAGLFLLLFAECPTFVRLAAGALSLLFYHLIHEMPNGMEMLDWEVQGGLLATLSWGGMCLVFTVLADLYYRDRLAKAEGKRGFGANAYLIALAVCTVIAALAALTLTVNKGSVSLGYDLVCIAASGWFFFIITLFDKWQPKVRFLSWWGSSPILMFLLQYLVVEIPCALIPDLEDAGTVTASLFCLGVVAVISAIGYALDKNKKALHF